MKACVPAGNVVPPPACSNSTVCNRPVCWGSKAKRYLQVVTNPPPWTDTTAVAELLLVAGSGGAVAASLPGGTVPAANGSMRWNLSWRLLLLLYGIDRVNLT